MRVRGSSLLKFLLLCAAICVIGYLTSGLWLPVFGYGLIHDDGAAKADYAVVLGGDYWGLRVSFAGDLVRKGYVPRVLVSGPPGFYGLNEADAAIDYAASKGYPREWFIPVHHTGLSTRAEAEVFYPELQRLGAHSFLLVTSNFHSARARRIFLSEAGKHPGAPVVRMVASPDKFFQPSKWWRSREASKTVFFEWTKTVATALGM